MTFRLRSGIPSLRRKDLFGLLKRAVQTARMKGLSIVHFAILSNHIHLIAEAQGARALSLQAQSFGISFAKRLNGSLSRTGAVFDDRFHVHVLRTPTEARNALRYVLSNEWKHQGGHPELIRLTFDSFSSAFAFREPARLFRPCSVGWDPDYADANRVAEWGRMALSEARTWLLREGWKRAKA